MMMGGDNKKIAALVIGSAMRSHRSGEDQYDAEAGADRNAGRFADKSKISEYEDEELSDSAKHEAAADAIAAIHNRDHKAFAAHMGTLFDLHMNGAEEESEPQAEKESVAGGPYEKDMFGREPYEG